MHSTKNGRRIRCGLCALVVLAVWSVGNVASAQLPNFNPGQNYSRGTPNLGRSYFKNSGAYSPYLNLLQNSGGLTGTVPNYQSFVRPQLQQQRVNANLNRSVQGLQGNVASLQSQGAGGATGLNGVRSTGRSAGQTSLGMYYGNRLNYFPNGR